MRNDHVLLMTDVVDSTQLSEQLGDEAAAVLWQAHDHKVRDLLRTWQGQEIDKSDGFLVLFRQVDDAVACALALHRALAGLTTPLQMRAGIHVGTLRTRPNRDDDIRQGAKPFEVDGIAKPLAARIMGLARGGQTLLSASAREALQSQRWQLENQGYWRLKGLPEPVELFEANERGAPVYAPKDSPKAYRVIAADGGWTPLHAAPHSLPADRDQFIGRADAMTALAHRFHDGARLVSVLGAGGIGKTRFVLRFARDWLGDFPGGAWFCDLSSARSLDGIVQAVAGGLSVPLGKLDPVVGLGAVMAGRGTSLVVLDNFEQVVRHAEITLGHWLAAAPKTRFLVTSRVVLGIAGEQVQALEPLPAVDAARLFALRAEAADDTYRPTAADLAAVPTLVELLDRLPLAIELAAARVRVMTPQAMSRRMDQRLQLLGGASGRRDRQATLRATLDWSWDLLSTTEQSLLAQLSVFDGGFRLDDAEAVADLAGDAEAPWVVDVVQQLVEKSLLRRLPVGRFDLLRTVQEYAGERLSALDVSGAAYCRHWRHFATFDDVRATADRCADLGNLVAACCRAAATQPGQAVNALVAAWSVLRLTGPFRTLIDLAAPLTARLDLAPREALRLHGVLISAHRHLGNLAAAERHLAAGLSAADRCPEALEDRCHLLVWQAELDLQRGHLAEADVAMARASDLAEACDSQTLRLLTLSQTGSRRLAQGMLDAALAAYAAALAIACALGNVRWEGGCQGNLGNAHHQLGHLAQARTHYDRAVALAMQVGDRVFEGNARSNLGLLLHEQGDDEAACAALTTAVDVARQIGHQRLEYTARCNLGIVNESLGDAGTALEDYRIAIRQAATAGDPASEGQFGGYLALLLARHGQREEATALFNQALALITPSADPYLLALLKAQRSVACRLHGEVDQAEILGEQANALAHDLGLGPDSEIFRLLNPPPSPTASLRPAPTAPNITAG